MENNNYKKPTFNNVIHKFEYNNLHFASGIEIDGQFYFCIGEANTDGEVEMIYEKWSSNYHELKELFFTFHTVTVPHEVKVEGGYEDGTYKYPKTSGDLYDMLNDLTSVE